MELNGGRNHKMGFKNLIEVLNMVDLINIEAETSQLGINIDKQRLHSCDTTLLKYDHEHLISIGKQVKVDRRLKILDYNVVKITRNIRINHQACRGKRKKISRMTPITSDNLNVVKVLVNHNIKPLQKSCQMIVINPQSIKSKEHLIMEYLMDKQGDLAILMETWLCEEDETWVNASECDKNGYKLDTVNRKNRRGEGIGLIYQETIKVLNASQRKHRHLNIQYGPSRLMKQCPQY